MLRSTKNHSLQDLREDVVHTKNSTVFKSVLEKTQTRLLEPVHVTQASEVVLASYFSSRPDPQRHQKVAADNDNYFKPWVQSIRRLDINGIIFHDGLSTDFIKRHTDAHVGFQYCRPGSLSLNDERFLCYQAWLSHNPAVQNVFMTDISDVIIKKNPFPLIRPDLLLVGQDRPNLACNFPYIAPRLEKYPGLFPQTPKEWVDFKSMPVYNAGIVGGDRTCIEFFLNWMNAGLMIGGKHLNNINMAMLNFLIFRKFKFDNYHHLCGPSLFSGAPLCNTFFSFDTDQDVYFIHK